MNQKDNLTGNLQAAEKQDWIVPVIRETIPVRQTAGGAGNVNNQDDIFYATS